MDELSSQEEKVLAAIGGYWEKNGISPTLKEIAAIVGIRGMGTLHLVIERLEKMGYLRRTPNIARSLVLLEKA